VKQCSKCKVEKELTEFHKHKSHADGLNSWCVACKSERRRKYYEANKEKILDKQREYNEANRDKRLEYGREWSKRKYGLTAERYNQIIEAQNHRCASCNRSSAKEWPSLT